jgi:sugar-specific transcriptional regulator TrmB
MDEDLTAPLVALGLRTIEARAYLALVQHGPATAAEVADSAAVSRPKVYEALKVLEREGLCMANGHKVARYRAVPPSVALPEVSRRREQARATETRHDEDLVHRLLARLPSDAAVESEGTSDGYMVAKVGSDETLEMLEDITRRARSQLDLVLGSPQVVPPAVGLRPQIDALRRGVNVRAILDNALLDVRAEYEQLSEAGAETRWLAGVPLRLVLRDSGVEGVVALVAQAGDGVLATTVGIKHPELAAPFQVLFNRQWRLAKPRAEDRGRSRRASKRCDPANHHTETE